MRLRHAILGLLSHQPQSGYDLNRAFTSSVVYFWHADQSQIYRTLDRLEADGAISTQVIPQSGRPDRRLHSLTESGRAELDAWLMSPLEPNTVKDPLLARVFFAARLGHERVDALLSEAEERFRRELEELEAIDIDVVDLDTAMKAAVLRAGIDGTKSQLEWLAQTRRTIAADASSTRSGAAEGAKTADEDGR
ncbi:MULTISPECIES: PadR family transcriptional regulator [Actinomyces]|uniref:PadR family transcriptional regulator n=1 Tax=Actinomyces oris TaxID=544580 RepID=A0A1Q8VT40_9ACTO|nr:MULTISPECIES: PadR family transcriptional regulator [Actinomyces]OLO51261.1 PadR family transcriptional regulator [Actinomyces oris]